MKKRGGDYIYGWTRSGYNLLQDKKEQIMIYVIYVIYVIHNISNRILDFFWELPNTRTRLPNPPLEPSCVRIPMNPPLPHVNLQFLSGLVV